MDICRKSSYNQIMSSLSSKTRYFFVALTIAALAQIVIAKQPPKLLVAPSVIARPAGTAPCQVTVLVDDHSNSQNARAPSTRFKFARAVYLIKADEIAASGFQLGNLLNSIGWTYGAPPLIAGSAPLTIYMQNTADTTNTKSTNWATAISSMTVVHNAVTTLPDTSGAFNIAFVGGSLLTYTGGGLYIAFDWGEYTGTLSTTASVRCNAFGLVGGLLSGQSNTSAPTTLGASDFRPETRLPSAFQNDAGVGPIYSYGELPLGLVPAQAVNAVLTNRGTNSFTSLPATLNVTGANSLTDTQMIPTLASCGGQAIAVFAGFTATALGSNVVTVSVPSDDLASNNALSRSLDITSLSYSYKHPGSTASGGTGFDNTGTMAAKFTISAANAVAGVKLEFTAASATHYRVAILEDAGNGTPTSTPLYVDSADRTVSAAGPVNITLPSPVAVGPGNFFVGIEQTNNTSANLSCDIEQPVRVGSFFSTSVPPTEWHDFAPLTPLKLNIGVILQTPAPLPPTPSQVVSRKTHGGVPRDIALPLTGSPGIECRSGGASNDYQMVFTFPSAVTFTNAAITTGAGSVSGSSGSGTTAVTVNLTGVTNAQKIMVTLQGASDGTNTGDLSLFMGMLLGDVNGNAAVNSTDISQTKLQSGQPVTNTNFRQDVIVSGSINATDVSSVKLKSGTSLP